MSEKKPEIYKTEIKNLKSKVQNDYYYSKEKSIKKENSQEEVNKDEKNNIDESLNLIEKINAIFKKPDFVYQADVNIMYKNGENINKKIIGLRDNDLITIDGEKININEIKDIK